MPGNYTSLEVMRVAKKWGCRIEDRQGGHCAIWAPKAQVPIIMRDVNRPARGFTSPKMLARLALAVGASDIDALMAGPPRLERQSLNTASGKLPELAKLSASPAPQFTDYGAGQPLGANQNRKEPEVMDYWEIADVPHATHPDNVTMGDVFYQVIIAMTTERIAQGNTGEFEVGTSDILAAIDEHEGLADRLGVLGGSRGKAQLSNALGSQRGNFPHLNYKPGSVGAMRRPVKWSYRGPARLHFGQVESPTTRHKANRANRPPVEPPEVDTLRSGWDRPGLIQPAPRPAATHSTWVAVGTSSDGSVILRGPDGAIYRAVAL